MQQAQRSLYLIRLLFDCLGIILSFAVSIILSASEASLLSGVILLCLFLINWALFANATGLYDEFRSRNFSYELISLIKTILTQSLFAIVILFFLRDPLLSRQFVIYYLFSLVIILSLEKFALRRTLNSLRRSGRNTRSMLIIGAGDVGKKFYDTIINHPHFGYRLVGFLDDQKQPWLNGQYLGTIDQLQPILESRRVDSVIVALPNYASEKLDQVINICQQYATHIRIIPDYFKYSASKYSITMFGSFPLVSVRTDRMNELHWRILKRSVDLIFTTVLFLGVFSWLWPLIIILQRIFDPGPVFYKPPRWGREGREFKCYKFRSMIPESRNVDKKGRHRHTDKNDPRITGFGGILRKTNLDELPQFINVLKGEMSLVGPRPHDVKENLEIKDQIDSYMWRYIGKPGVTGWAQVNGFRGGTDDIDLMRQRTEYDIWYIENWSLWLDMQILVTTLWNMLKGDPQAY